MHKFKVKWLLPIVHILGFLFTLSIFFDEIYWSSTLKDLTQFWRNGLGPYLLYNKDNKIDAIFLKKSDLILNDKEQNTSQNVASNTIEVGVPQNKKLKPKPTHIKEKSKNLENLYTCVISVIKSVMKIEINSKIIALNVANVKDGFILAV